MSSIVLKPVQTSTMRNTIISTSCSFWNVLISHYVSMLTTVCGKISAKKREMLPWLILLEEEDRTNREQKR